MYMFIDDLDHIMIYNIFFIILLCSYLYMWPRDGPAYECYTFLWYEKCLTTYIWLHIIILCPQKKLFDLLQQTIDVVKKL